jgi:tetratricopeptide (TPR) repeat protein
VSYFSPEISDKAPVFLSKQLEVLYNKIAENPKDYLSHKQYAEILLERPNKDRAARAKKSLEIIFNGLEEKDVLDSLVLYLIALRYLKETKNAKHLAETFIQKYPNTVGFHVQLIQILHLENKIDQAKNLLDTALKKFHDEDKLIRLNIRIQESMEKHEMVLSLCNKALHQYPDDQRIVISKCYALVNLHKIDVAILEFEKFKEAFPHNFNLPMWGMEGDYFSCSSEYARICMIASYIKSPGHHYRDVKNNHFVLNSVLTEDSKNLLIKAIDETTEILSNTNHHATQNGIKSIQAECYLLLGKFPESTIVLDEIPSEYDFNKITMQKILALLYSKKFQKCVNLCLTYLDSFPDDLGSKQAIALSYLELGNKKEYDEWYLKITDALEGDKTSKQADASFHLNPKEHYDNYKKFMNLMNNFSGKVYIINSYTKARIVELIRIMIDEPNNKVTEISIIGGLFNTRDGGHQFYNQYLKLQEEVRIFNSQKFGCQIKFRISSNGAHARYYMDRNQVYRGTGDEQVLSSSIDDFQLVTKQKDEDDIRKTWKRLWTDPKCLPLPNNSEDVEAWKKILTLYDDKRAKLDHEKKDIELIPKIEKILDPDESKKS